MKRIKYYVLLKLGVLMYTKNDVVLLLKNDLEFNALTRRFLDHLFMQSNNQQLLDVLVQSSEQGFRCPKCNEKQSIVETILYGEKIAIFKSDEEDEFLDGQNGLVKDVFKSSMVIFLYCSEDDVSMPAICTSDMGVADVLVKSVVNMYGDKVTQIKP